MLQHIVFLIIGFGILILGADALVNGSSALAKRFRISELIIGLTIVAFGTSAPELVVNIVASSQKLSNVVLGNVIGSNIFNLLLILGVSGVILPVQVHTKTVWREIPFSLLAALLTLFLAFFLNDQGMYISRFDGLLLLCFFLGFMIYIFWTLKSDKKTLEAVSSTPQKKLFIIILLIVVGLGGLILGGRMVVNRAVAIAEYFNLSEKLIGLTIISVGTSLPELATSVTAALKKKADLAVGNVIGSNIFNLLLILGTSALIHPVSYSPSFNVDIMILILATIFLFVAMFSGVKQKLDRWEAAILVLGFFGYMIFLIVNQ